MEHRERSATPGLDRPLFAWEGSDTDVPVIRTVSHLVHEVESGPTLYIRYSGGPAADAGNGPSIDYEASYRLPGLSVATLTPEPWWTLDPRTWIVRRIRKYAELNVRSRYAWVLTGTPVARGPDHEPLVRSVRPVARLHDGVIAAAAAEYRARFDVGEDSRGRNESRDEPDGRSSPCAREEVGTV